MDCHLRHSRFVMVCLKSVMTRSWCAGHPNPLICDRHFNECKATERESQRTTGISRQSAVYTPYIYRFITDHALRNFALPLVVFHCFVFFHVGSRVTNGTNVFLGDDYTPGSCVAVECTVQQDVFLMHLHSRYSKREVAISWSCVSIGCL